MDFSVIHQLLEKISKGVYEVQTRSIVTLHSKIHSKVLKPDQLITHFSQLPGVLLNWINENQECAQVETIMKIAEILLEISKVPTGSIILEKYGSIEFFSKFMENFKSKDSLTLLEETITLILTNIVQGRNNGNISLQTAKGYYNDISLRKSRDAIREINDENVNKSNTDYFSARTCLPSEKNKRELEATKFECTRVSLDQTVVTQEQTSNKYNNKKIFSTEKVDLKDTDSDTYQQLRFRMKSRDIISDAEGVKEIFHSPPILLTEADEKIIFDIGVQLKFADAASVLKVLKLGIPQVLRDFPIEVLKSKPEIVQELINCSKKYQDDVAVECLSVLAKIVNKFTRALLNTKNKALQNVNCSNAVAEFLSDDREYIRLSYPSLDTRKADARYLKELLSFSNTTTSYEIMENIMLHAFDLVEQRIYIHSAVAIQESVIGLLAQAKTLCDPSLIKSAIIGFVLLGTKIIQKHSEEVFNESGLLAFFLSVRKLFCILKAEDLQKEDIAALDTSYKVLFDGCFRCIYNEQEANSLLEFSSAVWKESFDTLIQVKALTDAIENLRKIEEDISFQTDTIFFLNGAEYLNYIDKLEEIVLALPYVRNPRIIKLFLDIFLFSLSDTGKSFSEEKVFERTKSLVLRAANIPVGHISLALFQQILENFHSKAFLVQNKHSETKKNSRLNLVFEAFLDVEFASELLAIGCTSSNPQIFNTLVDILFGFFSHFYLTDIKPLRVHHIMNWLPTFQIQGSQGNNKAFELIELLKTKDNYFFIRSSMMNCFSKDERLRQEATTILSNRQLVEASFSEGAQVFAEGNPSKFVRRSTRLDDVLTDFLNREKSEIIAKDDTQHYENPVSTMEITVQDFLNLQRVYSGSGIELNTRLSALEQMIELLVLHKSRRNIEIDQFMRTFIFSLIGEVQKSGLNIPRFIARESSDEKSKLSLVLIAKILSFINCFFEQYNFCDCKEGENIKYEMMEIICARETQMLKYLLEALDANNPDIRLQTLRTLFICTFANNFFSLRYQKPGQPKNSNIRCAPGKLNEQYFLLSRKMDEFSTDSSHKYFWAFFPLSSAVEFYIEEFIRKNDPAKTLFSLRVEETLLQLVEELKETGPKAKEQRDIFQILNKWTQCYIAYSSVPELFYDTLVGDLFKKILGAGLLNNQQTFYMERAVYLLVRVLKEQKLVKDYASSQKCREIFESVLEYFSGSMLSYFYEIPQQSKRERMDFTLSILVVSRAFLKFSSKVNSERMGALLFKKVLKQSYFDTVFSLLTSFPNHEEFLMTTIKLGLEALKHYELLTFSNLSALFKITLDQLISHEHSLSFITKGSRRKMLQFVLSYTKYYDQPMKAYTSELLAQQTKFVDLKASAKASLMKNSVISWLIKFTTDRSTEFRTIAWNILTLTIDKSLLGNYQSLVDSSLNVIFAPNEALSVIISTVSFLSRVVEIYLEELESDFAEAPIENEGEEEIDTFNIEEIKEEDENDTLAALNDYNDFANDRKTKKQVKSKNSSAGSSGRLGKGIDLDAKTLLKAITKRGLVSHIKTIVSRHAEFSPFLFANFLVLLRHIICMDSKNMISLISQLELWESLVAIMGGKCFKSQKIDFSQVSGLHYLMMISNNSQLLIYSLLYQKPISDYLINSTNLLYNILKLLKRLAGAYENPFYGKSVSNALFLNECIDNLIKLLSVCISVNEDLTVFSISKYFNGNSGSENRKPFLNIYQTISSIIQSFAANDALRLSALGFIGTFIPKWPKFKYLLDREDSKNGETISENLTLQAYNMFKQLYKLQKEKLITIEEFYQRRVAITTAVAALVSASSFAKKVLLFSGLFTEILRELNIASDCIMIEDSSVGASQNIPISSRENNPTTSSRKTASTAVKLFAKSTDRTLPSEDMNAFLRILKYVFFEWDRNDEESLNLSETLVNKLMESSNLLFETLTKLFQIACRKEDLFVYFSKIMINFSANKLLNALLFKKIIEGKAPLLADILNHIAKFETVGKTSFAWSLRMVSSFGNSKELRVYMFRNKFVDNLTAKIVKIWERKSKDWAKNSYVGPILDFLLLISFYKDAQPKLLSEKTHLEIILELVEAPTTLPFLLENLYLLLANISYSSKNKAKLLCNQKIAPLILTALSSPRFSLRLKAICSQFMINLMYKSGSAISLFNKEEVKEELKLLLKESERAIDKINLTEEKFKGEEEEELMKSHKVIVENLGSALNVLGLDLSVPEK